MMTTGMEGGTITTPRTGTSMSKHRKSHLHLHRSCRMRRNLSKDQRLPPGQEVKGHQVLEASLGVDRLAPQPCHHSHLASQKNTR